MNNSIITVAKRLQEEYCIYTLDVADQKLNFLIERAALDAEIILLGQNQITTVFPSTYCYVAVQFFKQITGGGEKPKTYSKNAV